MIIVVGGGGLAIEVAELSGATAMYAPIIKEHIGIKILSKNEFDNQKRSKCKVYLCAGKPLIRKYMFIESKGAQFPTLEIGEASISATIGCGSLIMPKCYVSSMVTLENFVLVNYGATVGHNTKIGSYSTISPNASIGGYCNLGENVYVGAGANIKEELNIGKNCIIGMGAVIIKDIPPDHIAIGNPAKIYSLEEWKNVKSN